MTNNDSRETSGCVNQLLTLVNQSDESNLLWPEAFYRWESSMSPPAFPADYATLVNAVGPCDWLDHVSIFSPGEKMNRLQSEFREDYPSLCELGMVPKEHRYSVYPDCGGIMCVGGNDNGGYIGWLTQGDTDKWPVVLMSDDGCDVEVHHRTLSCLLLGWINGEISSKVLLPAELLRSRGRSLFRRVPYAQ